MKRKLFCEINSFTYKISVIKERFKCTLINCLSRKKYSKIKLNKNLERRLYKHNSLIMRKLGNSDHSLQENKKINLQMVVLKLDGIMIYPGEVFSFWNTVGKCSKRKGYLNGVTISNGNIRPGVAGGLCQMTNLIHWMVLHSPLEITEHHHHHRYDIFPDFKRQIPFGTGTSIMYNYLDYQFKNNTNDIFQLRVKVSGEYLKGEIRSNNAQIESYHIAERNHKFTKEGKEYYRNNEIYRRVINKRTGNLVREELVIKNKSLVMYDPVHIKSDILLY